MIIINNTACYAEYSHSSLVFLKQKPDYREIKNKKQNICPDGVTFDSNKKWIVLCRIFYYPVHTERIRFKIRTTCMFSIRPNTSVKYRYDDDEIYLCTICARVVVFAWCRKSTNTFLSTFTSLFRTISNQLDYLGI